MSAEHLDIASYLIDQGIDLNSAPSIGNQTPPMVWAVFGQKGNPMIDVDQRRRLLAGRSGAGIAHIGAGGRTRSFFAPISGHIAP